MNVAQLDSTGNNNINIIPLPLPTTHSQFLLHDNFSKQLFDKRFTLKALLMDIKSRCHQQFITSDLFVNLPKEMKMNTNVRSASLIRILDTLNQISQEQKQLSEISQGQLHFGQVAQGGKHGAKKQEEAAASKLLSNVSYLAGRPTDVTKWGWGGVGGWWWLCVCVRARVCVRVGDA